MVLLRPPGRPPRPSLVLAADLAMPVIDPAPSGLLGRLGASRRPVLRTMLETLEQAASDADVQALVVRIAQPARHWGLAAELRAALRAFSASGRPVVAAVETFGEAGDANLAYYVASACDEIHLQPSGDVGITGVAAETRFFRGVLDKLGIVPQLDHRHEFKSAKERLTETSYSTAHREAEDRIVASLSEELLGAIAEGRGVSPTRARELVDAGPWLGAEALEAGLVDRLAYRDETVGAVRQRVGDHTRVRTLAAYRASRRRRLSWPRRRTSVALVHGTGQVHLGRSRGGLLGPTMGADTLVTAFRQALRAKRVRAIVFRVDSPGGSAVASDAIWREVCRAQRRGVPVVVSMGDVAGSGGYWVAMPADRIVAQPTTLTGSIGVVGGKLLTAEPRRRLGITTDEVHRGENALMASSERAYTEGQWERVSASLDKIYQEFVDKVADGRRLPREQVEAHARGRVWTGADARQRGLVDELGGYREALAAVRRLVDLPEDAPLALRRFPRPSVAERLGVRSPELEDAASLLRSVGAATDALRDAGVVDPAVARMPGWPRS